MHGKSSSVKQSAGMESCLKNAIIEEEKSKELTHSLSQSM
jgi:hypothetical protein